MSSSYPYGGGQITLPGGTKIQLVGSVAAGWGLLAAVRAGDNSATGTDAEYYLQRYDGERADGHRTWDFDVGNGFFAHPVVDLAVSQGSATWTVDGGAKTLTGLTYGRVSKAIVSAVARLGGSRVRWTELTVTCTRANGSSMADVVPPAQLPVADSRDRGGTAPDKFGSMTYLEILPPTNDCTGIVIQGRVEMLCERQGVTPHGDEVTGQAYVYFEQMTIVP